MANLTEIRDSKGEGEYMTWFVIWSPEGRTIIKVEAKNARAACRKAPAPYRKFKGELYAIEDVCVCKGNREWELCNRCIAAGER